MSGCTIFPDGFGDIVHFCFHVCWTKWKIIGLNLLDYEPILLGIMHYIIITKWQLMPVCWLIYREKI